MLFMKSVACLRYSATFTDRVPKVAGKLKFDVINISLNRITTKTKQNKQTNIIKPPPTTTTKQTKNKKDYFRKTNLTHYIIPDKATSSVETGNMAIK